MLRPRPETVLVAALLLVLASAAPLSAGGATSLAEAQALSAERNLPIVIDFFAEW